MSSLQAFKTPPLPYDTSFETPEADEAETARALSDQMRKIQEITFRDYGHAVRSVHAKSHGLLQGEMTVLPGPPEELRQGIFADAKTYPVVMRFSTNPGDILADSVSAPRGLALKVVGVAGERLPGAEGAATQDFVLVNGPAFSAPNAAAFLKSLKLLAATTDKPEILKKVASAALRGAESVVETFGGESPTLKTLGGHPNTHILGETFHSQVPILYGRYVAKISVAPATPELKALTGQTIDASRRHVLREVVQDHFAAHGGEWEVRVQLLTDRAAMPVEDASVIWPEEKSPHIAVARIRVAPQTSWSSRRVGVVDDRMSFSPWHGVAAHRPLGSIMRTRRLAYERAAEFRETRNRCPIHEPASAGETGLQAS